MVIPSRVFSCINTNGLCRSFHIRSTLFDETTPTEGVKPTETVEPMKELSLDEQLAAIKSQLDSSEKELKDLKDKNVRLLAEMQNVRTIAKRDVQNERLYSIQSFGKSLLCVCDYLGLAISSVPKDKIEGDAADKTLVSLYQGVVMTQAELEKVLGTQGIKKFGVVGETFNPHIHEAMYQIPLAEGASPNTLGQIVTFGYMFKERVLRPCKAGVFLKKEE